MKERNLDHGVLYLLVPSRKLSVNCESFTGLGSGALLEVVSCIHFRGKCWDIPRADGTAKGLNRF